MHAPALDALHGRCTRHSRCWRNETNPDCSVPHCSPAQLPGPLVYPMHRAAPGKHFGPASGRQQKACPSGLVLVGLLSLQLPLLACSPARGMPGVHTHPVQYIEMLDTSNPHHPPRLPTELYECVVSRRVQKCSKAVILLNPRSTLHGVCRYRPMCGATTEQPVCWLGSPGTPSIHAAQIASKYECAHVCAWACFPLPLAYYEAQHLPYKTHLGNLYL